MSKPITEYEPKNVWKYFAAISAIPRESGNEEKAIDYLESVAKEKNLECYRDDADNLLVKVPASAGNENTPAVLLQGHIDMVCVKTPESKHDFKKDGIDLQIRDGWLSGAGTTLGADNGMGVSSAFAMIDETETPHPPLEILVTTDEEVGMTGAIAFSSSNVSSKILVNLDSMDFGHFYIGCAGGGDCVISFPTNREEVNDGVHMRLRISGLSGGHSGLEIHKNSASSNKLLVRILHRAIDLGVRILSIKGGIKRNVIPSESIADIIIPEDKMDVLTGIVNEEEKYAREEYSATDPNMNFELEYFAALSPDQPEEVINKDVSDRLICLLAALPHGVLAMSRDVEGLVETSNNIGVINDDDETIAITCTFRSSVNASKIAIKNQIIAAAKLAGAQYKIEHEYPGWTPNLKSKILRIALESFRELFDGTGIHEAKHAGLETGILMDKIPGLDVISFGPDIVDAHSVGERVRIESVEKHFKLLKKVLEKVVMEY